MGAIDMSSTVSIAVLECDEPVGETRRRYGGFGNLFRELLEAGAANAELDGTIRPTSVLVSKYDVVHAMEYPDLASIDAVLLTGSRCDSFSDGEGGWITRLVDFVSNLLHAQNRVRVIGVCFGHQIIARALGVMPSRSLSGWETSVTSVKLTDRGKELFGTENLALHQMHRDFVPFDPPQAEILGRTACCSVQGMYIRNRLISLQGHPEFTGAIVKELLERRHGTLLDDETYGDGIRRADYPHDGVAAAATFMRFLLED